MEAPAKTALNEPVQYTRVTKELWAPSNLRTHPLREKRLLQRMESCIKKLGDSRFYHNFSDQVQTSSIYEHLCEVLGSYSKMQMVIYGIGNLEPEVRKDSRFQLSLAILMQRDFKWIGSIQVFDPQLSAIECRILEALGCSIVSFDENGFRKALEPTLFFMPHCPPCLYNNLLRANWNPDLLSKVVILGNSFNCYRKDLDPEVVMPILAAGKFTKEFTVNTNHPLTFLKSTSWMFFKIDQQFMNRLPYNHEAFCVLQREIDLQIDPYREKILMQEMERCVNNFGSSKFYCSFQKGLQAPPISQHFHTMIGSEVKMKIIIIYDIESIEFNENSRLHLSFAILMKKRFKWVEDVQVFHPFISATECHVLNALGCSILSLDEYRRSWQALKPTMFFFSDNNHTDIYNHLLKENWNSSLQNLVICGSSLRQGYTKDGSNTDFEYTMRYNGAARGFVKELRFKTTSSKAFQKAFHHLTWHFFGLVTKAELKFMNRFLEQGCYISYT